MDEETLTVWLDTALLMLGGFILMTVLMLSLVNPPAKSAQTSQQQRMADCNAAASAGGMKGDARQSFMSDCLKKK